MKIETIVCGSINTNSYILYDEKNLEGVIIDPAEGKPIMSFMERNSLRIKAILLTHGHYDHIEGIPYIIEKASDIPIYIDKNDEDCLTNPEWNGSFNTGNPVSVDNVKEVLDYNDELKLGNFHFNVFSFPGHTPGSVVLKYDNILFSGDFIFKGSVGRTNYFRGSHKSMIESLKRFVDIFSKIDSDLHIFPGHMESTKLSYELQHNPFLVRIINNSNE
jgi:glyoxylase-like metal-dependent hydrolase (beta-lactamase superfamily II)